MAERSTAAVDVADNSGDEPLPAKAEQATADGVARERDTANEAADGANRTSEPAGAGDGAPDAPPGRTPGAPGTESGTDDENPGETAEDTERAEPSRGPSGKSSGTDTEKPSTTDSGGDTDPDPKPGPARAADRASGTEDTETSADTKSSSESPGEPSGKPSQPPELHSGHKLAGRYRLEECVTRLDGFSSWRAVDEKLRRAVGVHLLPADHPRARSVLAAARSSALLGDPRFVQVLDAVEENDLVYVVQEWLPDATELTALLASGPLEVHDAYQMVSQVAQAMTAAHREGLAHLRLNPGAVLRTSSGQWRVRGLAVNAALRGITSEAPQRADVEAIGALLYAALTQRWPYESDAYGLHGLPKGMGLIAPDQVRAGVHRGLSELAMRALVNDGATASRQDPPCTTAEDLLKAISALPRIRPPEPAFTAPPEYRRTAYQQGAYRRAATGGPAVPAPVEPPPPPLQSRTGRVLKWGVSALLIAALGLGSWQLADALLDRGKDAGAEPGASGTHDGGTGRKATLDGKPLKIDSANEFAPSGSGIQEDQVPLAVDGKKDTAWVTPYYQGYANFGNLPNRQEGSGIIVDLGSVQDVSGFDLDLYRSGQKLEVLAAGADASGPTALSDFPQRLTKLNTVGSTLKQALSKAVRTRYVLIHITSLPPERTQGRYRGGISEIKVLGTSS
ncbi:serine/threonine protein kinase [Streptomyces sulfonofaciens]|uniref:serine/threonine protein kinase n=1 Tax=Streptomyces sulfonofaciens TaxID=68272 RepID=UPI001E4B332D|nr:serine/threonine protein kinase [Streptomyces sulfonofaciens]